MIYNFYSIPTPNWISQVIRETNSMRNPLKFWVYFKNPTNGKPVYKCSFPTAKAAHDFSRQMRSLYAKLSLTELVNVVKETTSAKSKQKKSRALTKK